MQAYLCGILTGMLLVLAFACGSQAQSITGGTISGVTVTTCGPPANFCSPTDSTNNQTSFPTALKGHLGVNKRAVDAATGNLVIRASDYSMANGTSQASFRTNSDSNGDIWSSDDTAFGLCMKGGALYVDAFDPVGLQVSPKGIVVDGTKGLCDAVSWAHATPLTYFAGSAPVINKLTINPNSSTWVNSTGGTTDISNAISKTQLIDLSASCPGLTWDGRYQLTNPFNIDPADRFLSFQAQFQQEHGFVAIQYDSQNGCHWTDFRSMTDGGSWGHSGSILNAATEQLQAPAAPTLAATTGGSLTQTHTYNVKITYTDHDIGETPASVQAQITVNNPNNAISVTPPTQNPTTSITQPTGFNVYVCDNTASPGCNPVLQTNGTNASGVLAQGSVSSITCSGCSGTTTHTALYWGLNAGGTGPQSATLTSGALGTGGTFTVNINAITNATSYNVCFDSTYVCVNTGSLSPSFTFGPGSAAWVIANSEISPIGTTPVITSLASTGIAPPASNTLGIKFHSFNNDATGTWGYAEHSNPAHYQSSYTSSTVLSFIDFNTGTLMVGAYNANLPLNVVQMPLGHGATGFAQQFGNDSNTGNEVRYNLNDSAGSVTKTILSANNFFNGFDQHFSPQGLSTNSLNPWMAGTDGSGYQSHAVPNTYLGGFLWATENKVSAKTWKFCENWESGLQGFNSMVSGNPSPDMKFWAFTSDGGIGAGLTSGTVGDNQGNDTCTDNTDATVLGACQVHVFICVTR